MTASKKILVAVFLAGVLIASTSVLLLKNSSDAVYIYPAGPQGNYTDTLPYWEHQIRTYGAVAAYARLGVAMQLLSDGQKHSYAHVFGEALFKVKGPDGISACDTQYQSGCYHQFLGSAFAVLGLGSIERFAEACKESEVNKVSGCYHGLGHGILSQIGYTRGDLDKALSLCDSYFHDNAWNGCLSGVFMEYNIRDISSGGVESGANALALTDNNRYTPCFSLADQYRYACVHELPVWWRWTVNTSINVQPDMLAIKIGGWCGVLSEQLRTACMRGLGHVLIAVNADAPTLLGQCNEASAGNPQSKLDCLAGAARRHHIDYPKAELLCAKFRLPPAGEISCQIYETSATL